MNAADAITTAAVIDAIDNGHDTIDRLATYFGVKHVSYTLRSTLYHLHEDGLIVHADIDGVRYFSADV